MFTLLGTASILLQKTQFVYILNNKFVRQFYPKAVESIR